MTENTAFGFATDGGSNTETTRADSDGERPTDESDAGTPAVVESLTDPTTLRDRDDVPFTERTYTHEEADHCEATALGRVVVGVTNDDGEVLLLVRDEDDHAILPNCVADEEQDWAAAARDAVEETTGVAVELRDVVRLRRVSHEVETDGEPRQQNTTHHVVFRATPAVDAEDRDDPAVTDDTDWTAGWYDELPVEPDEEGDVVDDIQTFLD